MLVEHNVETFRYKKWRKRDWRIPPDEKKLKTFSQMLEALRVPRRPTDTSCIDDATMRGITNALLKQKTQKKRNSTPIARSTANIQELCLPLLFALPPSYDPSRSSDPNMPSYQSSYQTAETFGSAETYGSNNFVVHGHAAASSYPDAHAELDALVVAALDEEDQDDDQDQMQLDTTGVPEQGAAGAVESTAAGAASRSQGTAGPMGPIAACMSHSACVARFFETCVQYKRFQQVLREEGYTQSSPHIVLSEAMCTADFWNAFSVRYQQVRALCGSDDDVYFYPAHVCRALDKLVGTDMLAAHNIVVNTQTFFEAVALFVRMYWERLFHGAGCDREEVCAAVMRMANAHVTLLYGDYEGAPRISAELQLELDALVATLAAVLSKIMCDGTTNDRNCAASMSPPADTDHVCGPLNCLNTTEAGLSGGGSHVWVACGAMVVWLDSEDNPVCVQRPGTFVEITRQHAKGVACGACVQVSMSSTAKMLQFQGAAGKFKAMHEKMASSAEGMGVIISTLLG